MTSPEHKALEEVLQLPQNRYCVDCGAKAPSWASINLGLFMCIDCSGIHRMIGTHITKIKSTTLDGWRFEWVAHMQKLGNVAANATWEAAATVDRAKISPAASMDQREKYIRAKYERQTWKGRPSEKSIARARRLMHIGADGQDMDAPAAAPVRRGVNPAVARRLAEKKRKEDEAKAATAAVAAEQEQAMAAAAEADLGALLGAGEEEATAADLDGAGDLFGGMDLHDGSAGASPASAPPPVSGGGAGFDFVSSASPAPAPTATAAGFDFVGSASPAPAPTATAAGFDFVGEGPTTPAPAASPAAAPAPSGPGFGFLGGGSAVPSPGTGGGSGGFSFMAGNGAAAPAPAPVPAPAPAPSPAAAAPAFSGLAGGAGGSDPFAGLPGMDADHRPAPLSALPLAHHHASERLGHHPGADEAPLSAPSLGTNPHPLMEEPGLARAASMGGQGGGGMRQPAPQLTGWELGEGAADARAVTPLAPEALASPTKAASTPLPGMEGGAAAAAASAVLAAGRAAFGESQQGSGEPAWLADPPSYLAADSNGESSFSVGVASIGSEQEVRGMQQATMAQHRRRLHLLQQERLAVLTKLEQGFQSRMQGLEMAHRRRQGRIQARLGELRAAEAERTKYDIDMGSRARQQAQAPAPAPASGFSFMG